jgi:type I restriction enzyme S subunit
MAGRYRAYPEYKDSGVEWLGDVPEHWHVKKLKYISTHNDEVLSELHDREIEIEYVDIGGVSATHGIMETQILPFGNAPSRARRIVRHGDVIISTVRTYLKAIAPIISPPINIIVSTGFAVIRPQKGKLNRIYSAYALITNGFIYEVESRSVGVSYPAINSSTLVEIQIPLPSYSEQTLIAAFLDHETSKIDTLIEKQQKLIALLKEKRQAVISHAVTKGLNPDAPMKDSGVEWLGEVPAHWEVKGLSFVLNAIGDVNHYMPQSVEKGIPYLMTGDLEDLASNICFKNCKQVSHQDYLKLSKRIKCSRGDVIMARYATIGTVSYIDVDTNFLVSYSCVTIKPNAAEALGLYLFYYFKSDAFVQGVQTQVNTNTQGNVGVGDLKKVKVALPPLAEQSRITDYLKYRTEDLESISDRAQVAINLLQERRTALISAAVTGKIDVRDWQPPPTHRETI